jgi:hypothetical protein
MVDKLQTLQEIITLSEAMLENSQKALWDSVSSLAAERQSLIALLFSEPAPQDQAETIADGIRTILLLDTKTQELTAVARFDLFQLLQSLEQGKKAVKAYTS